MILGTSSHNMFKKEFKSNLALFVIMIFVLFCALPFTLISMISNYENSYGVSFNTIRYEYIYDRNSVIHHFLYGNVALMLAIAASAFITGIYIFQFVHSRQKTDFYFSMPVKRSSLFWCKYLQPIIYVAISLIVNILIVFGIAAYKNCLSSVFVVAMLQRFVSFMFYFVAVYGITITAVFVTGKTFFSVLGGCTLGIYFPAFVFLLEVIFNGNAKGLLKGVYHLYKLSPHTVFFEIFENEANYDYTFSDGVFLQPWNIKALIGIIIFAILFTALSYWLFLKRPAEAAGKTIIYSSFKKVVKLFLVFAFSIGTSWLLPVMLCTSKPVHIIVSFIVGILFSIFVLDALIELNFFFAFKNWKKQWAYILVCCIGLTFGYGYSNSVKYHGFEDIPVDYTQEKAIKDGVVLFVGQEQCYNKELLFQFEKDVNDGKDAKLRIAHSDDNYIYGYNDLIYENGFITIYNEYDLYSNSKYKYFVKIENEFNADTTSPRMEDFTKYTDFYLSDKKKLTKDDIENNKYVSGTNEEINYEYVCTLYE